MGGGGMSSDEERGGGGEDEWASELLRGRFRHYTISVTETEMLYDHTCGIFVLIIFFLFDC